MLVMLTLNLGGEWRIQRRVRMDPIPVVPCSDHHPNHPLMEFADILTLPILTTCTYFLYLLNMSLDLY